MKGFLFDSENCEMSEKKYGHVCAVPTCFIKRYNSKKKFYRFPKDLGRARIWAKKANREDLLGNVTDLYESYRLCEIHFEERMFTSHLHTRLLATALPTLFSCVKVSSGTAKDDHSYSAPPLLSPKIQVLGDTKLEPAIAETDSADQIVVVVDDVVSIESNLNETSPPLISPQSIQSSTSSTSDTPRKKKCRQNIKSLMAENKYLRQRVQILENQLNNTLKNIL